jgi:hypothetical protein
VSEVKTFRVMIKLLAALFIGLMISASAQAENPDALLSKDSARAMFGLSQSAWEKNARQIRAAGAGDFRIAPTGEYSLYMRPSADAALLIVTPS